MNLPQDLPALLAAALDAQLMRQGALLSVKEAASGRYAHVNDAMAAFFDRAAQSIRGSTDVDLVGASVAASWRAAEQAALAQAQPTSGELRFEWAGTRRAAHGVGRPRRRALAVQHLD